MDITTQENGMKDIIKIYNFSHPVTNIVIQQLEEHLRSKIEIVQIQCQLDMERDLYPQLFSLTRTIESNAYIIPPGMGSAAAIVVKLISYHSEQENMLYMPRIIWLKRDEKTNQFILGGIE
jgi:hypothetical protein